MNTSSRLIVTLFLAGAANNVFGEDLGALKGFEFHPTVTTRYSYDNNVNKSRYAAMSDTYLTVLPRLRLASGPNHLRFAVLAGGDYGFYKKQTDLDYQKHAVDVTGEYSSGRYAVNTGANYERSQDEVGASGSGSTVTTPVYWKRIGGEGGARLGTGLARLTMESKIDVSGIRYDDAQSQWRNRNVSEAELSTLINLSGKTKAIVSAKRGDILYRNGGTTRNNHEYILSATAEWQGTGKTAARIELGLQNKDYVNPMLDGYTGLYSEISVDWQRRSYSTFHASYIRRTQESADYGILFFVRNGLQLTMNHALTHRWSISGKLNGDINELAGGGTNYFASTDMHIKLQTFRWLSMDMSIQESIKKSSPAAKDDYNSTIAGLNLNLTTRSWINAGVSVRRSRWRSSLDSAYYDATTIAFDLNITPRKI